MRKLFEFSGDETFWMVAKSIEQAEKSLKEDYSEEELFENEYETKELDNSIHFKIEDEDTGIIYDVWDMIRIDENDGIEIPYMIGSTLY